MSGDFNKRSVKRAMNNFPDIRPLDTGPTRGRNLLDIIATCLHLDVTDCGVTDPITSSKGTPSDHGLVYCSVRMPRVPSYVIEKYEYFRVDNEGKSRFASWAKNQSWSSVTNATSATDKVTKLHELFELAKENTLKKIART